MIELLLRDLLHRVAQINRAQQVSLSENSTFLGTGHFQSTTQPPGTSEEAPKFLPGHTIHISILKSIAGHRLCSALCVALFAAGYTQVFWRADSRSQRGKSEPAEHFVGSKRPGLLMGPLSPLPNRSGWIEQPCLTALQPSSHGQHLR